MRSDLQLLWTKKNIDLAWSRLLTNREAHYKNYFRDVYAAYSINDSDNLKLLSKKMKESAYIACEPVKVYIPKPNGLHRQYTLLSIEDQIVYQSYANVISRKYRKTPSIQKRYNSTVFGHLLSEFDSEFFYQPWENGYAKYNNLIRHAYRNNYNYIASFDLTACYDSIDHRVLGQMLEKYKVQKELIDSLLIILGKWTSDTAMKHGHGIPQGPMASGLLSEIVLSYFDEKMDDMNSRMDFRYFRYVDDIKIMAKTKSDLIWLLFLLERFSKEIGLFPQASKIDIHQIQNIDEEVKDIGGSFFGEIDEDTIIIYSNNAVSELKILLKEKNLKATLIKKLIRNIVPSKKADGLICDIITRHPELCASVCYYIDRCNHILAIKTVNAIADFMNNPTNQYVAGQLLKASIPKIGSESIKKLSSIAHIQYINPLYDIYDPLYLIQIFKLMSITEEYGYDKWSNLLFKDNRVLKNWWIQKSFIDILTPDKIGLPSYYSILASLTCSDNTDTNLVAAAALAVSEYTSPSSITCSTLGQSILIKIELYNSPTNNSHIPRIFKEIDNTIGFPNFPWKKYFADNHNQAQKLLSQASVYAKTDMTAFVSIFDSFVDLLFCSLFIIDPSLGQYKQGYIGSTLSRNTKLKQIYPAIFEMADKLHAYRTQSHLSHAAYNGGNGRIICSGTIPYKEKPKIIKCIKAAMIELDALGL